MRQMSPVNESPHGPAIFEGTIDSTYQYSKQKIAPSKVGRTEYYIQAFAHNKPTDEVLTVRFNWKKRTWESSWIIVRELAPPILNPKKKLAEHLNSKVLERKPWAAIVVTTVDPKTIKIVP